MTAGQPVTALVDSDSLRIDAYFEETRLPRIHVGDRVSIRLMGEATRLNGHVESIAGGIEDRERQSGANLLANINPTFSWVRLAQRIPVRIALENVPDSVRDHPRTDSDSGRDRVQAIKRLAQTAVGWLEQSARS